MKWIKDMLGINRYAISYNYHWGDIYSEGTYTGIGGRGMSKFVAQRVTKDVNEIYGPGTHWVVPLHE